MVMREGIQDVERMAKHYNTVDGDFLRRHQDLSLTRKLGERGRYARVFSNLYRKLTIAQNWFENGHLLTYFL